MKKKILFIILLLFTLNWQLSIEHVDCNAPSNNVNSSSESTTNPKNNPSLIITSHYPQTSPSSNAPLLSWEKDLNAVYYELEIFDSIPYNLDNKTLSNKHLYYTASIFANAYQLDLSSIAPEYLTNNKPLYWRVRAMDFDGNPASKFSNLEELYATNEPTNFEFTN